MKRLNASCASMYMQFANELKDARDRTGQTQQDLANLCFVSRTTYLSWETAKSAPTFGNALILCKVLGIDPTSMMHLIEGV